VLVFEICIFDGDFVKFGDFLVENVGGPELGFVRIWNILGINRDMGVLLLASSISI